MLIAALFILSLIVFPNPFKGIVATAIPLHLYLILPLAVGLGVFLMIMLNITHPPAGGNPIIVIMGSVSLDYIINPIISGTIIVLIFGVVLNRLILKKKYPL